MAADPTQKLRPDPLPSPERRLLGKIIDQRYRVLNHIGSGGMAHVYEVQHVALGRHVAMKVLHQTRADSPKLVRRFNHEARAASRLASEHVVSIHDYGVLPEGFPYFVMELLRGQNLRGLLRTELRLPVARAVNIAIDVCLGLHAAHTTGLVHRDLKPENLWLARGDDGREKCVLLDFGVARFEGVDTTSAGVLVGTARYMSPEQIGSERAPGPASDLFSLGLVLYECLTGISPFAADSLERTLFRILNDTQKPASSLVEEVPQELSNLLDRVLAKEPEHRFKDAMDFAAGLRAFAGVTRLLPSLDLASGQGLRDETLAEEPRVDTGSYGAATESARSTKSHRRPVALSFGAGLLLGATGLFALRQSPKPSSSPPIPTPLALPSAATAGEPPQPSRAALATVADTSSPAPTPSPSAAPSTRSKSRAGLPAAASVPKPAPSEPPKPTFDGRNPYLQ
jgi:eukaryotic-like serine/threonine-protein kinase